MEKTKSLLFLTNTMKQNENFMAGDQRSHPGKQISFFVGRGSKCWKSLKTCFFHKTYSSKSLCKSFILHKTWATLIAFLISYWFSSLCFTYAPATQCSKTEGNWLGRFFKFRLVSAKTHIFCVVSILLRRSRFLLWGDCWSFFIKKVFLAKCGETLEGGNRFFFCCVM